MIFSEVSEKGIPEDLEKPFCDNWAGWLCQTAQLPFNTTAGCANRLIWKLVRGLFFIHLQRLLPQNPPPSIELINGPNEVERLNTHGWFQTVRDTEPLGRYGKVFDYKWLCVAADGLRGHAFALLIWDHIVVLSMFHDPSCPCGKCREEQA